MADRPSLKVRFIYTAVIFCLIAGAVAVFVKMETEKSEVFGEQEPATLSAEAADSSNIANIREYEYIPADRLPPVEGPSQYRWDPEEKIVRFGYNVWIGWLPVIAANHGTKPNPDSVFYRKYGFKVDMVLMANPVAAQKAFAAGEVHTLWGTVDTMVLLAPKLIKDSRSAPRIVQLVYRSSGGDGLVVRDPVKSIGDLRNGYVTLARDSPSEYFLTWLLLSAGLRPGDLNVKYTATVFEAAAALVADAWVDGCVSWAPDIYRIPERVPDTKILADTGKAGNLIAGVYAVRADFARDHPEIVEGLISGIFEGMKYMKERPEHGARWMADAFGMQPEEVMEMRSDAHATNFAENVQFFLNSSNPTNFECTWESAGYVFKELRRIKTPIRFDRVVDFTFLQQLQKKGTFARQKVNNLAAFTPAGFKKVRAKSPILTPAVRIGFYPNSANPYDLVRDEGGNALVGKLYDPNAGATLAQVARFSRQFSRAVVLIEGHTDSSRKGQVPVQTAYELSTARAAAVRDALVDQYGFEPDVFRVEGKGWDVPANPDDPENQSLNRRVEISVFPPIQ